VAVPGEVAVVESGCAGCGWGSRGRWTGWGVAGGICWARANAASERNS